jgi:hypothetical protein
LRADELLARSVSRANGLHVKIGFRRFSVSQVQILRATQWFQTLSLIFLQLDDVMTRRL